MLSSPVSCSVISVWRSSVLVAIGDSLVCTTCVCPRVITAAAAAAAAAAANCRQQTLYALSRVFSRYLVRCLIPEVALRPPCLSTSSAETSAVCDGLRWRSQHGIICLLDSATASQLYKKFLTLCQFSVKVKTTKSTIVYINIHCIVDYVSIKSTIKRNPESRPINTLSYEGKGKGQVLAIAPLTSVRLAIRSAFPSRKWQLLGVS